MKSVAAVVPDPQAMLAVNEARVRAASQRERLRRTRGAPAGGSVRRGAAAALGGIRLRRPSPRAAPGPANRPDGIDERLEHPRVMAARGVPSRSTMYDDRVLGARLAAVGGVAPRREAPSVARTLAQSKLALDPSMRRA